MTDIALAEAAQDTAPPDLFLEDVLQGLSQAQKAIPARWFYDLRGSELFEEITDLPEYYPTRTEVALLERHCREVGEIVGHGRVVVEFGSGSSAKTPVLLRDADAGFYVPIDISGEFLRQSARKLEREFPDLPIIPVEADFMRKVELPSLASGQEALGFFPGSTIGNMVPRTAVDLLRSMRATLGDASHLLIGIDRVKDQEVLKRAYDDTEGVTALFNLNLLDRINRELDADIPVDAFCHSVRWNENYSRIEMHLEATRDLAFEVEGKPFEMREGETIHTENSHKYTPSSARLLLRASGWDVRETWSDPREWFMLILAEANTPRMAP